MWAWPANKGRDEEESVSGGIKREGNTVIVETLNVGTMPGKGRQLGDVIQVKMCFKSAPLLFVMKLPPTYTLIFFLLQKQKSAFNEKSFC